MGGTPWMNIHIMDPCSNRSEQVGVACDRELGETVTSRWKGLGWVPFQEYLGMLWQVVRPVQDAFLWAGALHPELGQWVHAGTSCHLSRCHRIMLWGRRVW